MPPPRTAAATRDARGRFVRTAKPASRGWWPWLRGFLWSGVVLGGLSLVGVALSDTVTDALKGVFAGALSTTSPQACAAREWWTRHFGTTPAPDPGRFRILVARLHNDDGSLSRKVEGAFRGERGFSTIPTCRSISLDGADRVEAETAAERLAEALRAGRGADLILWGEVADAGAGAVRL